MGRKTRVLIADDHSLVREGISALIARCDDLEVAGEAADGKEAIDRVAELRPDIILLDIAMPGLGGLEAAIEIRKISPETRIVVLSQYEDRQYVRRFLKVGVSGYMLKRAAGSELLAALRAVAKGDSYLAPSVAAAVIDDMVHGRQDDADPYETLSDREKQVLKLIAEGHTHKEVAAVLGISEKTVIAHQTNISEKLDMHSKAELIKFAISKGIIKL